MHGHIWPKDCRRRPTRRWSKPLCKAFGVLGAALSARSILCRKRSCCRWCRACLLHLRRSKTDQQGQGRDIAIPRVQGGFCPTHCLQAWIDAAGISSGALFRQVNRYDQVLPHRLKAQSVALIVKERAAQAGLDPTLFSGHSLRAGFVTNATNSGASSSSIRAQTGHQSDAMLQRYVRNSQLFSHNPNLMIW